MTPDLRVSFAGGGTDLPASAHHLRERSEQNCEHVAGSAGRQTRLQTAREDNQTQQKKPIRQTECTKQNGTIYIQ